VTIALILWTFLLFLLTPVHAEAAFSDVAAGDPSAVAVAAVTGNGWMSGYADGTFRPERMVNRAEFLKSLLLATNKNEEIARCTNARAFFRDVAKGSWYESFACFARRKGIVRGYDDRTLRPAERISLAEASSMIAKALHLTADASAPWYVAPVTAVADRHIVPSSIVSVQSNVTRGDLAEMLARLKDGKADGAASAEDLFHAQCQWYVDPSVPGVDMEEVRRVWRSWVNGVRAEQGLDPYVADRQLDRTAAAWAQQAAREGSISHKRPGQTAYYDYAIIKKWFEEFGLSFRNVDGSTFTENIGWGKYACTSSDCTDSLLKAVRTTFDFFVAEKNKTERAHWNSIVNDHFRRIGVGVAVNPAAGNYYLTVHYGTAFERDPKPICP
jgi:uncharacterized protein YkwD